VPVPEAPDRTPPTSLTVILQPESATVQISNYFTFLALVGGYASNATVSFQWEWNKFPFTTNFITTNLTWRDLNIGSDNNFTNVPGSPNTNLFTIGPVTTNEVAYYRVTVTAVTSGVTNVASSAAAPLWAYQPTNSTFVWGTPVYASNGSSTPCSGSYHYVTYFPNLTPDGGIANYLFFDESETSPTISWFAYSANPVFPSSAGWGSCGAPSVGFSSSQINRYATYYFSVWIPSTPVNPDLVYATFH
jgi:hypothetical protein